MNTLKSNGIKTLKLISAKQQPQHQQQLNSIRCYSSLSATPPTNKPKFTLNKNLNAVNARKAVDNTRNFIYRGRESLDRGLLGAAERFIVSSFKDFQKKIDFSSSLFAYPTYAVGLVSLKKGYYLNSEKFFKLSLNRNEAIDDANQFIQRNIVESTNDLGLTLLRQGRTEESGFNLFKAEDLALKYQTDRLLPSIYSNIGEYYKDLCYYDKSNYYHGLAHHFLSLQSDELNLARCYLNRSQILRLSNMSEESSVFLNYGAKGLIKYLNATDSNPIPKHMDWSKLLLELGHHYYNKGDYATAKSKFINAKTHFQQMNNENTPDAIINVINLAILERNQPTLPTLDDSNKYINGLITSIQQPLQSLRDQKFNSRSRSIDNILKQLDTTTIAIVSDNNNNNNNNTANATTTTTNNNFKFKQTKLKLVEPLHFQLMIFESDQPSNNLDFLKANYNH